MILKVLGRREKEMERLDSEEKHSKDSLDEMKD